MKTQFHPLAFLLLLSAINYQPSTLRAQGMLAPPAGTPAPAFKTLQQIEPRTDIATLAGDSTNVRIITQVGSYYLTENLIVPSGKNGIRIQTSGATVDLNGFNIIGGSGTLHGIDVASGNTHITIQNGGIGNCANGAGINAGGINYMRIINVRSAANGDFGVRIGSHGLVKNCVAIGNAFTGFAGADGCVISESISRGNSGSGFSVFDNCLLINCTAIANSVSGFTGTLNNTLIGCMAISNSGNDGISLSINSVVRNCTASFNSGFGSGISASGVITDCTAMSNGLSGISASAGSIISGCRAGSNGENGISLSTRSVVIGNECDANVGAGIFVGGGSNRIEANNVSGNDRGFWINQPANIIFRNTASGSTGTGTPSANYNIGSFNSYGPIVNVAGVGDISGTANANHPWANFSY